jgi:sensor domain CHASE-containing protein
MNDKIITALLAILIALGGWTLSRTFSLSQDMVLIKEKVSQVEETIDKNLKKKKKKKKKSN